MTIRSSVAYGVVLAAWLAFGLILAHAFMATPPPPTDGCVSLPQDLLDLAPPPGSSRHNQLGGTRR